MTTQLNKKQEMAEILKAFSNSLETIGIMETAMYPLADTTWTAIPLTCVGKSSNWVSIKVVKVKDMAILKRNNPAL